jgi:nucleoside-diphosphate-sugar epimerase
VNFTAGKIGLAFVTGATGLLGNNLVRELVARGIRVRALTRSREKAQLQLGKLPVEIVVGDMSNVAGFAPALAGVDTLFHTAAHFRDSYKGGHHWQELYRTNVEGTKELLSCAYRAGVRQLIHTSSIAVLRGPRGFLIDETMSRDERDADDYYRSKILSECEVRSFLQAHPDLWAAIILPGWMFGPGDAGPTSAGQLVLDFVHRKLPGIPRATFSVVDARDVAEAIIAAVEQGRRGERYLVAGRQMTVAEICEKLEKISGVKAPAFSLPAPLLYLFAFAAEAWARVSAKPVLLSLASVRLMAAEKNRTRFDSSKAERELGIRFKPVEETLGDVLRWYRNEDIRSPHGREDETARGAAAGS